jgi:hypothetical protein
MFQKLLTLDIITLGAHLMVIVTNDNKVQESLKRHGSEAHSLLNLLQAVCSRVLVLFSLFMSVFQRLDLYIDSESKRRHVKALIKMSQKSGKVPDCLVLKGMEVDGDPVAGGGYEDVYKGRFKRKEIALKVLKVYRKSDMEKLLKVTILNLDWF